MDRTVQRLRVGFFAVGVALMLTACGSSSDSERPADAPPASPSTAMPSPTPTPKASKPTAAPSPTPSATPSRKTIDNATKEKPVVTGVGLPKGFPKAVPLPATGDIKTASSTLEGWTIEFSGVSARDVDALRGNITSAGGTEVYVIPGADLSTAAYEMKDHSLQLMWMPKVKGKDTSFVYTVTKKSS